MLQLDLSSNIMHIIDIIMAPSLLPLVAPVPHLPLLQKLEQIGINPYTDLEMGAELPNREEAVCSS